MANVNTLFSYFTKKPASKNTEESESSNSDVLGAHKNGNKKTPPKAKIDPKPTCPFNVFDVVWTKLEGYPWWPSMVTNHPKSHQYTRQERKQTLIHVQFFDDPPTRGWVKEKFTKPFCGSDDKNFERGGQFFSPDPKCRRAAEEADKALKLEKEDRSSLVVAMDTSEEEEEEEEDEEDMEVDEPELDSSKENAETPKKTPSKKTPQKNCRSSARAKPTKRRRVMVASDSEAESGDEFKLKPHEEEESETDTDVSSGEEESDPDTESEPESPIKKRKRGDEGKPKKGAQKSSNVESFFTPSRKDANTSKASTPSVSSKTKSKLAMFSAPDESPAVGSGEERTFPHLSYEFLQPDNIKDKDGKKKKVPTATLR